MAMPGARSSGDIAEWFRSNDENCGVGFVTAFNGDIVFRYARAVLGSLALAVLTTRFERKLGAGTLGLGG